MLVSSFGRYAPFCFLSLLVLLGERLFLDGGGSSGGAKESKQAGKGRMERRKEQYKRGELC